ncbi:hypothetical protein ACHAWF_009151 [Thalassiosira exigua]
MPSLQNPLGNSKMAKFSAANPLAPLADPFSGMGDDEKELHKEVSDGVQKRLAKAMEDLKEKHRTGTNEVDDVDRAPTGSAYRELYREQRRRAEGAAKAREQAEARGRDEENRKMTEAREAMRRMRFDDEKENLEHDEPSDSEDEFDRLLDEDDDGTLQAIRDARIAQLKAEQARRAQHRSLGHGSLRTIREDEFLPETTGSSKHVIVHFYHDDFERCKIMDYHLDVVAREHLEAKFLRIDAAKSPFFVTKLRIKSLPALFAFDDGKEIGRLDGFEGLATDPTKPDEWRTGRLREWIGTTGAIEYVRPSEEVEEERRRWGLVARGAVYSERRDGEADEEY